MSETTFLKAVIQPERSEAFSASLVKENERLVVAKVSIEPEKL